MRTYDKPDVPAPRLHAVQQSNALTPETEVTVIFRGGPPVHDMCDSQVYTIPPLPEGVTLEAWRQTRQPASFWTLPYGIADHLRTRAIVPATRNPHEYRTAVRQLGILNVDRPERCQPFTDAEVQKFNYADGEGIDRSVFEDSRRHATVIETQQAVATALASGRDLDGELAAEPDPAATERPTQHEGLQELQRAEREAAAEGLKGVSKTRKGAQFRD